MPQAQPGQRPESIESAIREAVDAGFSSAVATLGQLVRIPSIAFAGFDAATVEASAEAVADRFRALGVFDLVDVRRASNGAGGTGQPAVIARRDARGTAPTVLLYAHHDVQPPGRDDQWSSPPFEPTLRGERLYGRGASDDKAGVVTHLAAVEAFFAAAGHDSDLGIAIFIEGEEEVGSGSFEAFLADQRAVLAADVIVVADSDNESTRTPSLTTSLRGNVTFALTVRTLGHASHSGMFGGAVPDGMLAIIRLLATLWDDDGSVAVVGLASESSAMVEADAGSEAEAAANLARDADLLPGVSAIGVGTVDDRIARGPAITVTGIDAPDVMNASNTLQPSVRVRISARVPPGIRAADAFEALESHLRSHAPFGAEIDIADVDLGDPYLADVESWAATEALAALADGWGTPPSLKGEGGSIPFIATLTGVFPEAHILITGVEDPDTRAHAPDESQHLGVLRRAILAEALLLARLSRRTLAK